MFIPMHTMSIVGHVQLLTGPAEVFKSEKALDHQQFCVWLDRAF